MKRHLVLLGVCVLSALSVVALVAQSTSRPPVDYDSFWTLDLDGRLRAFNEVTPENRADLVREHLQRWIDANRERLNAEQLKVLGEAVAAITPDLYTLPRQPEALERMKALEAKTTAVMSRDDVMASMTISGAYIPKKK